jgi:8-amino-7-oxononanoate synthase
MQSLDRFAADKLAQLDAQLLRRRLVTHARDGIWLEKNGRRLLSFSCNDYLNLSQHPRVKEAAIAATRQHGVGAGASRLVTGNHPLYAELESRLAQMKGSAAACVFGSGYLANIGIIPTLVGKSGLVLLDELAHACLWAGAQLTGGTVLSFRHNDLAHAETLLAEHRDRHDQALIATDGVFSMDGDLAPLPALAALARRHDAWLLTDDAHGLGVVGGGRGSAFAWSERLDIPLQMGTLSKAVGSYGAYLCASEPVIDLVKTRARSLIYSTGLPPPTIAAAIAGIDLLTREPELTALPLKKARAFTEAAGLPAAASPIVPILLGEAARALGAQQALEEEGFLVMAIRPPTVPAGTARLRLTFTAAHPDAEIARLAATVREKILQCPASS